MSSQDEQERILAVKKLSILDTKNDHDFDDLVKLATLIFDVQIATVTILDSHRQWFKASEGLEVKETPRDISFCTHAIQESEPLIVNNTALDDRFSSNPLVTSKPHLAFYAGIPIRDSNHFAIGTFCIMDSKPRQLTEKQINILKKLASQAENLILLRIERNKYRELNMEIESLYSELAKSEERWQFAIDGSGDGVWDWDIQNNQTYLSKRMLGYADGEIANTFEGWASLIHPEDYDDVVNKLNNHLSKITVDFKSEHRMLCKDKSYKWISIKGIIVSYDEDGHPKRMAGTYSDISGDKKIEEVMWRQANYDLLTGLPNRRLFFDRLKEDIKKASRANQKFALLFIDLDGFKAVNDRYGHKAGDSLLIQVSQRITQCIRESDTFARLAGDEFTIITRNISSNDCLTVVMNKILQVINTPFQLGVHNVTISASIGVSIFPDNSTDSDDLVSMADSAMYVAKANGKNCWSFSQEFK